MAKIEILSPFIFSFEGGFVNDPDDRGGATNRGVTIATFRANGRDMDGDGDIDVDDLKLISESDARDMILRPHYWNRWQADKIRDQSIANILVDWLWASGVHAIKIPQQILGVVADGIVGPKTLAALNAADPASLFKKLHARRISFVNDIVARNPSQKKFLAGWTRRINAIKFGSLACNGGRIIKF
ncbi:MAG: peptidoglycan domain protein [Bacteroidales bacterium]|nr:peptidoglycan domain protein [Bacteroidales bacterium]